MSKTRTNTPLQEVQSKVSQYYKESQEGMRRLRAVEILSWLRENMDRLMEEDENREPLIFGEQCDHDKEGWTKAMEGVNRNGETVEYRVCSGCRKIELI